VGEPKTPGTEARAQHAVLGSQELDRLALSATDCSGAADVTVAEPYQPGALGTRDFGYNPHRSSLGQYGVTSVRDSRAKFYERHYDPHLTATRVECAVESVEGSKAR
jgi:hypothetical protein